jgi:ATP-dependent Lon protease
VLPLRDIVVFPHMIVPLFVGREKSIAALEEVMRRTSRSCSPPRSTPDDDPDRRSIYDIGTIANVLQLLKLPDGTVKVLVEGRERAEIVEYTDRDEFLRGPRRRSWPSYGGRPGRDRGAGPLGGFAEFENYVKLNKKVSPEVVGARSARSMTFQARRHGCFASVDQDS